MNRTKFTPALLLLLMFLVGCSREKHQLRFHPAAGTNSLLLLNLSGRVDIGIPLANINEPFKTQVSSALAFDSTSDGTRMLFSFYPDSAGVPFPVNTGPLSDSSEVDLGRMFRSMQFGTTIDAQGKPGSVTGLDSLRHILNDAVGRQMPDNASKQVMRVDSFLTDGALTAMFELAQHVLPEDPVSVGDTWVLESQISPGFTLKLRKKFRLEQVSGDTAFISMTSDIAQRDPGAQINAAGLGWFLPPAQTERKVVPNDVWSILANQVELDIKGTMQGDLKLDLRTGMLQSSKLSQHLEGQLKMGSFTMPIKLDIDYAYRMQAKL